MVDKTFIPHPSALNPQPMSLKVFHIVFVIVCVALSLWVAVWGIRDYMLERSVGALSLGILFLLSGVVLVVYGRKAFEKLRDLP
jgi:hypothetical protein